METLSNFGERAFSQFPPDQIVSDPLGVVKVLEDVGCGATQRHGERALVPGAATLVAATLVASTLVAATLVAAVRHHVAVNNGHHNSVVGSTRPAPQLKARLQMLRIQSSASTLVRSRVAPDHKGRTRVRHLFHPKLSSTRTQQVLRALISSDLDDREKYERNAGEVAPLPMARETAVRGTRARSVLLSLK